jgi:hypothetical protein
MATPDPKKVVQALSFIEELGWFLESHKQVKLSDAAVTLREILAGPASARKVGAEYTSPNPNIHFLIGVLPRLFQDLRLFPNNAAIASFAGEVLGIKVSRYEKRSKYELIGLIVCETDTLSDDKLRVLVEALAELTKSEEKLDRIRSAAKESNFSWNEAIQSLSDK